MEIRADKGDKSAPNAQQDQQQPAEHAAASANPQHPVHMDHFLLQAERFFGRLRALSYPADGTPCKTPVNGA
jgi:hypothetical protein